MATRKNPRFESAEAKKLWSETNKAYELSAHELLILENACREQDIVGKLEEALEGAALTGKGSMGQMVANPLLMEVRQHRVTLASLIKQLHLPDQIGETSADRRSAQASAAANARWSK